MSLSVLERMFEKDFLGSSSPRTRKEFYAKKRFYGKEIAKQLLNEFKRLGWLEEENRGERIYPKRKFGLFK